MKLLSLKTKNFKKLTDHSFKFTDGMNFILGENGAGKSTLLRAIATAMFGVQMVPGHSDDIPTRGQSSWQLVMEFERSGKSYIIKRTKSSASIHCGEEMVASGNTPVTKFMEELLGISAKDYNLLIHSRQGETNYVINYGATALQRKVEEFAGADVVDKIATSASKISNDLTNQVVGLSNNKLPVEELEAAQKALKEAQGDVLKFTAEIESLSLETHPERPVEPSVTTAEVQNKILRHKQWVMEVDQVLKDKADLEQQLAEIEYQPELKPEETRQALDAVRAEKKTAEAHNFNILQVIESQSKERATLLKLEQELAKPLPVEVSDEQVLKLRHKVSAALERHTELRTKLASLDKSIKDGVCSECGAEHVEDLDSLKASADALSKGVKEAEELHLSAKSELAELEQKLRVYQRAVEEQSRKLIDKEAVERKLFEAAEFLSVNEPKDLDDLYKQEEALLLELNKITSVIESNMSLRMKEGRLQSKLATLKLPEEPEQVAEEGLTKVEQQWSDYRNQVASYNSWAVTFNQRTESAKKSLEMAEKMVSAYTATVQQQDDIRLQLAELTVDAETAKNLNSFLRNRRGEYLSQVWDAVVYHASVFLNAATKGWMTEVGISEGKFLFKEQGNWVPAVEASGAQEAFLGSALRIGLNKALYRGNTFMVFDEPTDGMREDNARNLVAEISSASHQVLVITHRESDQGLADNIIEV